MHLDTLLELWDRVRTSLWFIPGLIGVAALALAFLMPVVDRAVADEALRDLPLVFTGRPLGARAVLSTIATSMVTTAGVVFSMTIVSLQLASSQFGPRLLRTFLRDRGNQVVLGTLVGIFLYCIILLPSIDADVDAPFVPHLGVTVALLLAVVGLAMLVYFIDHVAQSIHADAVIRAVSQELETAVDHLFPEGVGAASDGADPDSAAPAAGPWRHVDARAAGYLRFINGDALLAAAAAHDLVIRIVVTPGQYVLEGDHLAAAAPAASTTDEVAACLRSVFELGAHRTALQDAPFVFEQLVEMAVRALSPGINDPTTAIHCVDRIGSGLARLVARPRPASWRCDAKGVPRVHVEPVAFDHVLWSTIDPIARNAGAQLTVWLRLLEMLGKVDDRCRLDADRAAVRARAQAVAARAASSFDEDEAQERLAAASAWSTPPDEPA